MYFVIEIDGEEIAYTHVPVEGMWVNEYTFLHGEQLAVENYVRRCFPLIAAVVTVREHRDDELILAPVICLDRMAATAAVCVVESARRHFWAETPSRAG